MWKPELDIRSDVAIIYGPAGDNFNDRLTSWQEKGYKLHMMTGVAWGDYHDYFQGTFDGTEHNENAQTRENGEIIWHHPGVPYVVPSATYVTYLKSLIKKAIDAGVTAIHLEEPEFWAFAGYSDSFKKEWQKYYGFDWMPQHESPEATYLSQKLKYHLYFETLKELFLYTKEYSQSLGRKVQCFVPTHSLVNYSAWRIVSPEAQLANLPGMDGYIAQVWTGTSRTPVFYNGIKKERVFENAFLEYGSMYSMTKPTGKKVFFLTDPIEDRARSWEDYKRNYEATFTAQLMYPSVSNYEVMPWPSRIFFGEFEIEGSGKKQTIPEPYATEVLTLVNTLNNIPQSQNKIDGSHGIAVVHANSMMFQRFPEHDSYDDPQLSNFYGMVLPLLKRGIPVELVHLEHVGLEETLKNVQVLILSYANYKPLEEAYHTALADWVKKGGILIYCGRDNDPYQQVKEWWNTGNNNYVAPSDHLFKQLGIDNKEGEYTVDKGKTIIYRIDPKEIVMQAGNDKKYISLVEKHYNAVNDKNLQFKNSLQLQRGPYDIVAVLDESIDSQSIIIQGPVIDLFDPECPVLQTKEIKPGQVAFLYNLDRTNLNTPSVLCGSGRVYEENISKNSYELVIKGPLKTKNTSRLWLPGEPAKITALDKNNKPVVIKNSWDHGSNTLWIKFNNQPEGINFTIQYK